MAPLDPDEVSPTFCVLPWIQVSSSTLGGVRLCCVAEDDAVDEQGRRYQLGSDRYQDAWNSPLLRETRAKMLRGEKVDGCKSCYYEESLGGFSLRRGKSEPWLRSHGDEIMRRVEASRLDDHRVNAPPLYLDLRQGNLCNLKCRMCDPSRSIMILRESASLAERDPWFAQKFGLGRLAEQISDWYDRPLFREELRALLGDLREMYFTGGEPTLIESNHALMAEAVERGEAAHIGLFFNTNATQITDEFLGLLPHFQFAMLSLSIDGVGRVQEYIRAPSKWSQIEKNLRRLLEAAVPNLHLLVTPTVQLMNVLEITDLFRFVDGINRELGPRLETRPNILFQPPHLEMALLPPEARRLAVDRLRRYQGEAPPFLKGRIDQMLHRLEAPPPADAAEQTEIFRRYTALLDQERGQSFSSTFPELAPLMG